MKCKRCGTINDSSVKFCRYCGSPLNDEQQVIQSEPINGFRINIPQLRCQLDLYGEQMVTLGRSDKSNIFINDSTVSREHAVLLIRDNSLCIADTRSVNRTYINGFLCEAEQIYRLPQEAVITFGRYQFQIFSEKITKQKMSSSTVNGDSFDNVPNENSEEVLIETTPEENQFDLTEPVGQKPQQDLYTNKVDTQYNPKADNDIVTTDDNSVINEGYNTEDNQYRRPVTNKTSHTTDKTSVKNSSESNRANINLDVICLSCAKNMGEYDICPYCGWQKTYEPRYSYVLRPYTILHNGKYIVGQFLARGGFGNVYVGIRTEDMHRVAIKEFFFLHENTAISRNADGTLNLPDNQMQLDYYNECLAEFEREAYITSMVTDIDGVVTLYDRFRENNTAYMVMEYLEGKGLDKLLESSKGNRLSNDKAIDISKKSAVILENLHKKRVLHCDVTPRNIYITPDEGVKIIDFGTAVDLDDPNARAGAKSRGYSPIEQEKCDVQLDERTDVYALSATLYHMVTGNVPVESGVRDKTSKSSDPLVPPSEVVDDNGNLIEMDDTTEKIILAGMSVDVRYRIEDMSYFVDALNGDAIALLPEEKRRKETIRRLGFSSIPLFLAMITFFVYYFFVMEQPVMDGTIEETSLSIMVEEDDYELTKNAVDVFCEEFPQVSIDIESYGENYEEKVINSINDNTVTLFRSDGLQQFTEIENELMDFREIYTVLEDGELLYNNKNILKTNKKVFPVNYDVKVVFYNKKLLPDGIEIDSTIVYDEFMDIINSLNSESCTGCCISNDSLEVLLMNAMKPENDRVKNIKNSEEAKQVIADIESLMENGVIVYDTTIEQAKDRFLQENALFYIGYAGDMLDVFEAMPGYSDVALIVGEDFDSSLFGDFKELWSINGNATSNQREVALTFMLYYVSEQGQYKHVVSSRDALPINHLTMYDYVDIYTDLDFLKDKHESIEFNSIKYPEVKQAYSKMGDMLNDKNKTDDIIEAFSSLALN